MDDNNRKTLAISFTCTALSPQSDQNIVPDDEYQERANALPKMKRFMVQGSEAAKKLGTMSPGRTSSGPVSLYVCSESRAIARRKYEFAFKGVDIGLPHGDARKDWERRKLGERGIWVDFERDVVFVDSITPEDRRTDVLYPTLHLTELTWFALCAEKEAKKITRLAVGGHWSKVSHVKRTLHLTHYWQGSPRSHLCKPYAITSFHNLKELFLDDRFSLPRNKNTVVDTGIVGDRQEVEAEILSWLRRHGSSAECPPGGFWKALEVRIVRGRKHEWDEL